jgi:hypothetical protein
MQELYNSNPYDLLPEALQSPKTQAMGYAVQIAMNILTQFKDYFTEDEWEKLIEHKAQIIQLMEYDTIGDFYR